MVFSSAPFIFVFLPLVILIVLVVARVFGRFAACFTLVVASLVFYGWWEWEYLLLIGISIAVNYGCGVMLTAYRSGFLLTLGLMFNIGLLGWFKYAGFFAETLNSLLGINFALGPIILPLAISFFTFQQIAYLVDIYHGKAQSAHFVHYCLFVTFFPQLIAGPIVYHKDVISQFQSGPLFRFSLGNLAGGGGNIPNRPL